MEWPEDSAWEEFDLQLEQNTDAEAWTSTTPPPIPSGPTPEPPPTNTLGQAPSQHTAQTTSLGAQPSPPLQAERSSKGRSASPLMVAAVTNAAAQASGRPTADSDSGWGKAAPAVDRWGSVGLGSEGSFPGSEGDAGLGGWGDEGGFDDALAELMAEPLVAAHSQESAQALEGTLAAHHTQAGSRRTSLQGQHHADAATTVAAHSTHSVTDDGFSIAPQTKAYVPPSWLAMVDSTADAADSVSAALAATAGSPPPPPVTAAVLAAESDQASATVFAASFPAGLTEGPPVTTNYTFPNFADSDRSMLSAGGGTATSAAQLAADGLTRTAAASSAGGLAAPAAKPTGATSHASPAPAVAQGGTGRPQSAFSTAELSLAPDSSQASPPPAADAAVPPAAPQVHTAGSLAALFGGRAGEASNAGDDFFGSIADEAVQSLNTSNTTAAPAAAQPTQPTQVGPQPQQQSIPGSATPWQPPPAWPDMQLPQQQAQPWQPHTQSAEVSETLLRPHLHV